MVLETAQLGVCARTFNIGCLGLRLSVTVTFLCISLGCGDGPTTPSRGAVVRFQVVDETFRVHLLDEKQINAAHQAATGGRARISNGRVVAGTGVNVG
jgi:hypothetical protein